MSDQHPQHRNGADAAAARRDELRRRRPSVWRSKSLRLMTLVMLVGLGLWVYAMATAPAGAAPSGGATPAATLTTGGMAIETPREKRLIDQGAPATFRLGFSFVVGFFVAWMMRKFIRTLLLTAGAVATVLIVLKATGLLGTEIESIQGEVDRGLELAQREASRAKEFILGYVPSGVSAAAGMLMGARRRD